MSNTKNEFKKHEKELKVLLLLQTADGEAHGEAGELGGIGVRHQLDRLEGRRVADGHCRDADGGGGDVKGPQAAGPARLRIAGRPLIPGGIVGRH